MQREMILFAPIPKPLPKLDMIRINGATNPIAARESTPKPETHALSIKELNVIKSKLMIIGMDNLFIAFFG